MFRIYPGGVQNNFVTTVSNRSQQPGAVVGGGASSSSGVAGPIPQIHPFATTLPYLASFAIHLHSGLNSGANPFRWKYGVDVKVDMGMGNADDNGNNNGNGYGSFSSVSRGILMIDSEFKLNGTGAIITSPATLPEVAIMISCFCMSSLFSTSLTLSMLSEKLSMIGVSTTDCPASTFARYTCLALVSPKSEIRYDDESSRITLSLDYSELGETIVLLLEEESVVDLETGRMASGAAERIRNHMETAESGRREVSEQGEGIPFRIATNEEH